jgi:hypothetical protein
MKLMTKALLGAGALALMSGMASAADLACLITKNNTNPRPPASTSRPMPVKRTVTPPRRSPRSKTASPLAPRVS